MRGDYLREVLDRGICPRCEQPKADIDEQYSFGCYAGVMCTACAIHGYRDACGHRAEGQGTAAEYEELAGPGTYYEEVD
jgi:hypothetical protein